MKTEHYPDLERCKKLTLLGFPETEKEYIRNVGGRYLGEDKDGKSIIEPFEFHIKRRPLDGEIITMQCTEQYVCPSVMELLDELPGCIKKDGEYYHFSINKHGGWFTVRYTTQLRDDILEEKSVSLPNALADMWIWAKEQKFIT